MKLREYLEIQLREEDEVPPSRRSGWQFQAARVAANAAARSKTGEVATQANVSLLGNSLQIETDEQFISIDLSPEQVNEIRSQMD